MENVNLLLNSYLIRQIETWAATRGMTLDEAVQVLLSRAFWSNTRGFW